MTALYLHHLHSALTGLLLHGLFSVLPFHQPVSCDGGVIPLKQSAAITVEVNVRHERFRILITYHDLDRKSVV